MVIGVVIFFGIIMVMGTVVAFVVISEVENLPPIDEANNPVPIAISQETKEFQLGEEVVINGMSYTVTKVRVWDSFMGLNLYTDKNSQLLIAYIKVKNVSNDPRSELRGFSLTDSEDRRFTGYYAATAYGDNIGRIQPGLEAKSARVSVFEIPFDPQLEYYLVRDDITVNLGRGNTFDIDDEAKKELGMI